MADPNAPEILPGSGFLLEAFWELSTDRQIGNSIGPVPFSAISHYADRYEIGGDEFSFFQRMIRAMDDVFLGYLRRKETGQEQPAVSTRRMDGALFDALFDSGKKGG